MPIARTSSLRVFEHDCKILVLILLSRQEPADPQPLLTGDATTWNMSYNLHAGTVRNNAVSASAT